MQTNMTFQITHDYTLTLLGLRGLQDTKRRRPLRRRCVERRRSGLRGKELRGNAARGSELRGNGARPAWQTRITHFYAVSANYGFGFL